MNSTGKKKILVIDDDPVACDVITKSLGARGCDVLIIADPAAAFEKARQVVPDLIFISLLLPGTNGLKVSKSIHAAKELRGIPVLMMISHAGELDPKYTVTIGIVDVLVKPLDSDEIIDKTLHLLGEDTAPPQSDEEPFDVYAVEEDEGAAETAASQAEPAIAAVPNAAEDRDAEIRNLLQEEEEQPEKIQEYTYEDEYDSYKDAEKQNTKKIILLASALFVVILLAIGGFFLMDSLFPSKKAPSPAGTMAASPQGNVSTEPAGTRQSPEQIEKKPEVPSPAVTTGKEALSQPPAVKPVRETPKKALSAPAETPKQTDARAGKPAPPKTAQAKPASAKKTFTVQVGVFGNKKNADSLAEKLKKQGYPAVVRKDTDKNQKPIFRLTVGSFDSRSTASRQAGALLKKEGIKSIVRQL